MSSNWNKKRRRNLRSTARRLGAIESLESRVVLTSNALGELVATVGYDADENGTIDSGELVTNASVELYRDTGDGSFDATDLLVTSGSTGIDGQVSFGGLATGNYFLVQPAQTVDGRFLGMNVSAMQVVFGQGVAGVEIDSFSRTSPTPVVDGLIGGTDSVSYANSGVPGGETDLFVELTGGSNNSSATMQVIGGKLGLFNFLEASGRFGVTWDGIDGAASLNETGLGGLDLTVIDGQSGQGAGICLAGYVAADSGSSIKFTVYTDANSYSVAEFSNLGSSPVGDDLFIPFLGTLDGVGFVGMGDNGGADFSNVGAIEVEFEFAATDEASVVELEAISVLGVESQSVEIFNSPGAAGISVSMLTNGMEADDFNSAFPVLNTSNSEDVVWTYVVTNQGGVPLSNIELNDSVLGLIGDESITNQTVNNDDVLDVGELWTYSVMQQAIAGDYTATATVTADGGLTDSDTSVYRGIAPAISIESLTNGVDADDADGEDVPVLTVGEEIVWSYQVTNTGDTPLINVAVADSILGDIVLRTSSSGNDDDVLDVGEIWEFRATGSAAVGDYMNVGSVTGELANQSLSTYRATDSDASHYTGVALTIGLEVLTNGLSAESAAEAPFAFVGSDVTFTYIVTNGGSVPLSSVTLVKGDGSEDPGATLVSGDENSDGILDVTETWTYQSTQTAAEGVFSSIFTVTATFNDEEATDGDEAFYHGVPISWHNINFAADVDNNGVVTPADPLAVINELNERTVSDAITSVLDELSELPMEFLDVNNDGYVSPLDAVLAIQALNASPVLDLSPGVDGSDGEFVFFEGEESAKILPNFTLTDAGHTHLNSVTITLAGPDSDAADSLTADVAGTEISQVYDSDTGQLVLSGSDTIANYSKVLKTLEYVVGTTDRDDADRTVTFVPASADAVGDPSTLTIVTQSNPNPVAVDDTYTLDEDTVLQANAETSLIVNDIAGTDSEVIQIETTPVSQPAHGDLTLFSDGTFTYTPDSDYFGVDTFQYRVIGGGENSGIGVVTLQVASVNDAPVAVNDDFQMSQSQQLNGNLLLNDYDADGDALTVRSTPVSDPANGVVTLNLDGTFVYTPDPSFTGTDMFEYQISDPSGEFSTGFVTILVVDA